MRFLDVCLAMVGTIIVLLLLLSFCVLVVFPPGNFVPTSPESTPQLVFENLWGHNPPIYGGNHMKRVLEAAGVFKQMKAINLLWVG